MSTHSERAYLSKLQLIRQPSLARRAELQLRLLVRWPPPEWRCSQRPRSVQGSLYERSSGSRQPSVQRAPGIRRLCLQQPWRRRGLQERGQGPARAALPRIRWERVIRKSLSKHITSDSVSMQVLLHRCVNRQLDVWWSPWKKYWFQYSYLYNWTQY